MIVPCIQPNCEMCKTGPHRVEVTSSRVCELCNPRDSRAMRALESLTPNGSEFVNDPERCMAFVRDRLAFTIQLAKERNRMRNALELIAKTSPDVEAVRMAKAAL